MAITTPALSSPGLGSGLDVTSIVTQLMKLEQQPLVALQQRAQQYDTQISAYGQLQSALSTFQGAMRGLNDVSDFKKFTATASDESVLSAQASTSAAAGKYNIQVDRLAQAHSMATAAQGSTAVFGGQAGDALNVSIDTFSFSIDLSGGMTLDQLKTAIDDAPDNPGVRAQLVNLDSSGTTQRLALVSPATGYVHRMQLTGSGAVDPLATFGFTTTNSSGGVPMTDLTQLDAALTVDGIGVTREENTITNLVPGVTLNLHSAKPGNSLTLDVARDTAAISEKVQAFAGAYNTLMETAKTLGNGDLQGDSSIRMLQNQVRGVLNGGVQAGTFTHLSQVGLSLDKHGTMQFDSTGLKRALDTDSDSVAQVFAGDGTGYAYKFNDMVDNLLGYRGLVQSRVTGLQQSKRTNEQDQLDMQGRLDRIQQGYYKQYTVLDTLVSQMTNTSNYLSQQLSALSSSK